MTGFPEVPHGKREVGEYVSVSIEGATRPSLSHPEHNEDRHFISPRGFGVFDGVGGYEGGQQAAEIAKNIIEKEVNHFLPEISVGDAKRLLIRFFHDAHEAIKEKAGTAPSTTATVVVFVEGGKKAVIANVGDSRVYLERDGRLSQLTEDDNTLKGDKNAKEIAKAMDEIKSQVDAQRLIDESGLDFRRIRKEITAYLGRATRAHTPDFFVIELKPGDRLLATSDGVHDNLTRSEIGRALEHYRTPQKVVEVLKTAALRRSERKHVRSKPDDITAVVAEVNFEREKELVPA